MSKCNILFYTYGKVHSTKGGTERTTISVANGLTQNYGCRCFSLFEIPADTKQESCFIAEYQWTTSSDRTQNKQFVRDIVIENQIDYIIDQGAFIHVKLFKEAVDGLSCKVILAHHFEPGIETKFFTFKRLLFRFSQIVSTRDLYKWILHLILYPYLRVKYTNSLSRSYFEAYQYADRVVLLSQSFIRQYQGFGRFKDEKNFSVIHNALSFNEYLPIGDVKKKKPVILIVSRFDEELKRLLLALRIWQEIKLSPIANDWCLKIVGHGKDLKLYQKYIAKKKIHDVYLLGRQDPKPYYKEASIFFMTSISESWGLTLTEAQQFGVVPVAFNTYASLTDIVTDEEDGVVIREGEIEQYVNSTLELIRDTQKRQAMAIQGIHNCQRFSQDKIAKDWWHLLNNL
ncbi:glycosyltransferase [Alistipes shahii]|uniref:glycosyltransferase n=1 Tax=Alistipes shahii TaxID=328814 RepID=UPI00210B79E0|nr:glycosyltransferase [Alistipes shahii]MCQ5074431.1 glycosyltransferase [Alistipes shahii]